MSLCFLYLELLKSLDVYISIFIQFGKFWPFFLQKFFWPLFPLPLKLLQPDLQTSRFSLTYIYIHWVFCLLKSPLNLSNEFLISIIFFSSRISFWFFLSFLSHYWYFHFVHTLFSWLFPYLPLVLWASLRQLLWSLCLVYQTLGLSQGQFLLICFIPLSAPYFAVP